MTVCVTAARLPSASMIEKWLVSGPEGDSVALGSRSLGVARSGWMPARRPAAYSRLVNSGTGTPTKSGSPR